MRFSQRAVVFFFKLVTGLICRIHAQELNKIPPRGPLIIYTNHVNILEIPIIYTQLWPRPVHGMVWAERWENRLLAWLLDTCEAIPLHRGEADLTAIRHGLGLLTDGHILIISPEGTRSGDGRLLASHPGVVLLALHSGAPLIPVAYHGAEMYRQNLRRLKRTNFYLKVGRPFILEAQGIKVNRSVRQEMLQEVMGELARLLPEECWGAYKPEGVVRYMRFEEAAGQRNGTQYHAD